jgi:hypothetical protein
LIRLAAFVKEKAPGDDQSLKLRWIQFERLSFAVYANHPGMLPDSETCHKQKCTKFCGNV